MLKELSDQFAAAVEAARGAVVQVSGSSRPMSGLVYRPGLVVTMMHPLHRKKPVRVQYQEASLEADVVAWDVASGLAILRTADTHAVPLAAGASEVRVGHLVLGVGRSWSNAVSASAGIIAVIGGPLQTGRRHEIEVVYRTTAPMHEGFTGGGLLDAAGDLIGIVSGGSIRGFRVVIPISLAWKTVEKLLAQGSVKRGFLGLAGHAVALPDHQSTAGDRGMLIAAVTQGGPSAKAGVLVGDVLMACDDLTVETPDDLIDYMERTPAGGRVTLRLLRAAAPLEIVVVAGERPE